MKLVAIDTFRFDAHANLLILRLRTDEGPIGVGETFYDPGSVEAHVHDRLAPVLLGRSADDPLALTHVPAPYVGMQGSGVEMRARSALDIAAWDLLGQVTQQPLTRLLGGAVRDDIEIYNTCAGAGYVQGRAGQASSNWGLSTANDGPYEDLHAFLTRPGELAAELVDEGISGMKIWPFDTFAERHGGRRIEHDELARGVAAVEEIRATVGNRIDVMIELHSLWDLPSVTRIARALEGLDVRWLEDPIQPGQPEALARLADRSTIPIAGGETIAGAKAFRLALDLGAYDIPILDPGWVGGITESVRVASLAATYGRPFAAHDCTGPIALAACVHLSLSQSNALIQETVRAAYRGWYRNIVTQLPPIEDARIRPADGPGLGIELQPDLEQRPDVHVRSSALGS